MAGGSEDVGAKRTAKACRMSALNACSINQSINQSSSSQSNIQSINQFHNATTEDGCVQGDHVCLQPHRPPNLGLACRPGP